MNSVEVVQSWGLVHLGPQGGAQGGPYLVDAPLQLGIIHHSEKQPNFFSPRTTFI